MLHSTCHCKHLEIMGNLFGVGFGHRNHGQNVNITIGSLAMEAQEFAAAVGREREEVRSEFSKVVANVVFDDFFGWPHAKPPRFNTQVALTTIGDSQEVEIVRRQREACRSNEGGNRGFIGRVCTKRPVVDVIGEDVRDGHVI